MFLLSGNEFHLIDAFFDHTNNFFSPSLRKFLWNNFADKAGANSVYKNPQPEENYNCFKYSSPGIGQEVTNEDDYPQIKALRKAQNNGTEVKIAFMPSNPNYEQFCENAYKNYYSALNSLNEKYGWEVKDLRSIYVTPELTKFNVFRDQIHVHRVPTGKYTILLTYMIEEYLLNTK